MNDGVSIADYSVVAVFFAAMAGLVFGAASGLVLFAAGARWAFLRDMVWAFPVTAAATTAALALGSLLWPDDPESRAAVDVFFGKLEAKS